MLKMLIRIWRLLSHTDTAFSMLGWWHFISATTVAGFVVVIAWLREQDPIILFVLGLGAFAAMIVIFERLAAWRFRNQSAVAQEPEESEKTDDLTGQKQLVPDWKICEAMDYIAAQFGNENEENLDTKYLEPARLLTSRARSGRIKLWGRRIFGLDNSELSQRPIEQAEWKDIELSVWACNPSSRRPHTELASHHSSQQYTDLYVNESQIKGIPWRNENTYEPSKRTARSYPERINRIVDHVSLRIDDSNSGNSYLATRHALRRAARDSRITFSGKKKKPGDNNPSKLSTPISAEFWNDQELTQYTIEDQYRHFIHTEPERDSNNQPIGERREQYWEVTAIMDEIKEIWP